MAMAATLASALPVFAIATLASWGLLPFWALLALVSLAALPDGASAAAFDVKLPELARQAGLPLDRVNAVDDAIDSAAAVAGLLILATDVGVALWIAFALGAASAALALVAVPDDGPAGENSDLARAAAFIRRAPGFFALVLAAAWLIAVFQTLEDVLLPLLAAAASWEPDALGLLMGAAGLGGFFGAVLYVLVADWRRARAVFALGVVLVALAPVVSAAAGWLAESVGVPGVTAVMAAATLLFVASGPNPRRKT